MNKIYKVIWSHARKCYVVVSEIAKNRGKNNTKSIVSQLAARINTATLRSAGVVNSAFTVCEQPVAYPRTAVRWIAPLVLAGILLQPVSGFASTITDKNGNNLIRRGNVQNLYVQTMLDNNNIGLNRFGEYKISAGDIANMHFNEQNGKVYANNLVNLVNSKIDINGTVNAVKNGKIDGNLYFISPDGMTVGPTGVINAGRVGVFIPNTSYWDELWKEDVNVKNNFADFENYGRRDENGQYKETRLAFADGKKIEIYGKINTRNGIVLGAQEILVKEGAVLKRSASTADVNFNDLVNIKDAAGTVTLSAGLDGELNAAVDGSTGDIILRAKSAHSYVNSFIPKETLESILHTDIQSKVEIGGSVNSDGPVDISALSKTSFTNLAYGGTSMLSDIGFNFLNDLGINMTASWVDKTNTATVALTDKGSIRAGGNVNLQTDAALDLRLKADVVKEKGQGTTTAIPVIAVGVMKLANSAVTDVKGGLQSNGNIRLAANADTTANLMANAVQNTLDNDPANSIYTGVAILTGNGLAEVNVAEGTAINAGGDFSASAMGTNQTAVLATAQGKHETFTSTAVAVSDYDSAANVNLGRSVTAKSVTGEAVNDVKSLAILADNSNGDSGETYVEFKVEGGQSLAAKAAEKLKNKLGVTGFQNGGVLLPVENFLNAAKDYVTAGAGIAVVDHSNTANLTVARGVALRAAGDSAGNGGDVTLKSETVLSTLNQIVTGQSNQKADENGGSTVTVAAGVLVSNIENTAATEVLGGAGSTLTSENGDVTVTANTETNTNHVITTLHRSGEDIVVKTIEERFDAVINNLENVGRDASKLKDIKKDFQRTWGQMQGIKDGHVTTSFFDALLHNSLANLVFSEWRDYYRINASFKALVDSLLDYLSPAAYTSHYVRSYSVNRNQGGDTNMDLAASVNVGSLAGKAVVSLGESVAVNAGKNIAVDAKSVSDLASITGTGGEFLSYSETNGNGVGASIAVQKFTSDAIALVGKNVTLNAVNGTVETDGSNSNVPKSGTVSVGANSDAGQLALIFSAGKSERNGFSGSFNIQTGGSNSLVLVDDEAKITAANGVTVGSNNDYVMNNIVGGLAIGGAGSNGTVGAGLALNQLDVNSMAVMGDNGAGASTAATDTDTESFKKKSAEEQNEIKAENAVIAARKLAADRAKVKKMDRSFAETERNLTAALGNKTEGAAKGFVTGRNISVTAKNDGLLNAIALEGANVSESHSVLDSINKVTRIASDAKEQSRQAIKNVADWPADRLASLFTKSSREAFKTKASLSFANYDPVNANGQNANASFNAEAAASFAWNNLDTQTAAIADNMTLNLRKQNSSEADGALVTAATDELFTGAWAGSGSVMWFTGAAQGMQGLNNNATKGALGTAVAVNKLDQKVNSLIMDSTITQAGSVLNTAIKNGSEVAAGLGVAVVNQTGGEGAGGSAAFGLSLNMVENDIHAILIDSSATYEKDDITYTGGTSLENRAHDGDIQVAGGANMAWIHTGGSGIAAGITAAASDLENDIQSGIQGGRYSGISNLSVKAGNDLTQVNAGVGLGVARSGGKFSVGGAGTLALNELENTSQAFIAGTKNLTAAGSVTVMAGDVASSDEETNPYTAYLGARNVDSGGLSYLGESVRDALGTGAGNTIVNVAVDVAESKGVSAGAAVSVNQVTNRISADITGNEQIEAASVNGEADVHSNIVSLATGASVSESSFGGAASVSWNDLQQDNIVSVTGNRDSEDPANGGILADSVTGTAQNTSHIVNVTGEFAGGQNSVGLSVAVNRMEDISGIYFAKNRIGERVANEGTAVSLNADNNAFALAIGVGVDANYKENSTAAAYGNFVANRGHNDTVAVIGEDKVGNKASGADRDRIDNAASVEVRATDETQRTTVAGSAQLALQGAKAALGAGVALTGSDAGTESGDGRETLRAEIINTDITTVKKNGTDAAVTAVTADRSKATTAIVGVGITKQSTVAAQGLGADARINKNNTAGLKDTTIDATGGSKTALVSVKAETSSEVNTGAAALQLAGPDSFLAGVVAVGVNRITDNTVAGVTYTNKPDAASLNVGNLDISAVSNGDITSVAMGASVAVKGTAAVGGSGSHNYIANSAAAKIENANIDSAGNVGVVAQSDEAITNYAGVIDVAAYGQGVSAALGVTGSNNKISGNTEALIRNSKVVAKGSDSNKIKTNSKLKTDDTYLINGAVTSNTWSAGKLQTGREEEEKTGVVVDASATHAIASVLANGGVAVGSGDSGAGASLAGVINLNDVGGSTTAKVEDSQLNEEAADKRSHVTVHAADYTNVAELSGAAAVGIGEKAGIAAGFTGTTNEISRATEAGVSMASAGWKNGTDPNTSGTGVRNYDIYAQDFVVTADAKQAMSAFNVTGAIAGSSGVAFETGDNVNTNRMKSSTVAAVTNTAVDYQKDAAVKASHGDAIYNLNVDVGAAIAPSQKGAAGSLNVGVGVVQESSVVTADVEHSKLQSSNSDPDSKSSLSVGTANTTTLETRLVSVGVAAGAFSGGIASSIAVNNISTKVTGNIVGSVLAADAVDVHTTNALAVHDAVGTGAGALEVGIGVGVDVTTINDSVSTIVDNSTVKAADTLSINTETQRETDSTVAGVGIGALSVAVNVLSVTVNDGIGSLEDVNDEEAGSSFSHSSMLNEAVNEVNNTTGRVLADKVAGMTADEKQKMQEKSETKADYGDNVSGAGVHTYVRGNSALEAVNGALTVNNTERNDADLNGGSGSLGLLAVNVADVVYHRNEKNNIAVADSTVKGGSIALTATQGNVTDNKTDAIRARTVQAQAGVAGIGVGYAGITAKGSTGVSVNHAALTAADGDLTLKSADTVQSRSNMIGVSAALLAVPVSVAHNTNKTDQYITVQGGSTLSAARKDTAKSAAVSLQTERTGRVASKTVGVGAGGVAVAVNSATSRDESVSRVAVSDSGNTFQADRIVLEAVNAPVLKAEAGGTDAALIGVSVMQSNAIAKSQAGVTVADNNRLLGDDVLARAVIGKEGTDMTHAETHGINVTVVGVNPDKAKAVTETTAGVTVGKETYKTEKKEKVKNEQGAEEEKTVQGSYTSLALISQNNASRRAILGNTTVGLAVSIGAGDAKTEGNDKSQVTAAGGDGAGAVKLQNLKIAATGSNSAQGLADGDSGGIIAVGAEATITMKTKTENTASLSGAWDVKDNADIGSFQQVTSRGSSKTGAGGVLSVTWANSDNNVEMNTRTELMEGARLTAGQSFVLAENKVVTGAYDGEYWSNHMNIGGVIQIAPDVTSDEVITAKADVYIGRNAKVTTNKGQVYEAYADMDLTNKVEGKSGGVGENMWVYSDNTVKSANKITVDEGAELVQDGEYENGSDIILSSSDKIKMDVAAEAYTGGLEGVLVSKATNRVTRNNGVEVNGKLNSTHDINLYAGADVDGSDAELKITGLSESHNNTLLSFYTSPKLQLDLKNNQQVKVGESGNVTAIRHINATAANGSESFRKEVVKVVNLLAGKDTSVKTVSNAPGVSDIDENNDNWVNVEGRLKTGIQNNVKIDITGVLLPTVVESYKNDNNQTVEVIHHLTPVDETLPKFNVEVFNNSGTNPDTIVKKEDIKSGNMDYATQLGDRLAVLETLISEYSNGNQDNTDTAAYLGYVQERQRILEEMDKRRLFTEEDDGKGGTVKVYINKGFTISYVEIPEITVSGGNIVVQSESLYGKGRLDANGAPRIEINNLSDAYLKLDGLRVGEGGGEIRFRGQSISAGDAGQEQINDLNSDKGKKAEFASLYSDSSSEVSTISVMNNNEGIGTELPVQDQNGKSVTYVSIPDVAVLGNITNNFGDVTIENKQGNITIGSGSAGKGANINGRMVQLIATTGSISQDYIDGIVNIGGRPQDMNYEEAKALIDKANLSGDKKLITTDMTAAKTNIEQAETGRIAGDSVYLAAADINVNGLIQSGYGKFEVIIPEKDENGKDILSDENIQKLKNNGSEVTVQGRTMYKLNDGNKAVYDESTGAFKYVVQVYYDPKTKELFVEDIDARGGNIYLTGRISSTEQTVKQQDGTEKIGNGRILAVDGGAEIAITNNTKANLTTGKILNNDVEGKITITDLAKDTWTEYTRSKTTVISDYSKQYLVKLNEAEKLKLEAETLRKVGKTEEADQKLRDAEAVLLQAENLKTDGAAIGRYDKDNPTRYETKTGLRYNWTLGQEKSVTCYYEKVTKTLFWGGVDIGTDTNRLSSDEKESNLTETPIVTDGRKLGEGTFIDTISDGYQDSDGKKLVDTEFGSVLESNKTSTSREVTGNWKEGGKWYALWSNPKYHTTWTTKEASTQAYTFSLKADNPIGIGFIGQKDGSITVKNANSAGGNINLNGSIQNNTKDATLAVQALGGSISQKSGTAIVTGNADLKAKNNIENIHITSMGEWRNTGEKDASGNDIYTANDGVLLNAESIFAGNIDLEVTGGVAEGQALPGNVIIRNLKSQRQVISGQPGGVTLKAEGNINQEGTAVAVQARTIHLTSTNGAIGSDGQALLIDSSAEAFGNGENSAGLNATAKNNINIEEAEGSMRVGIVVSQDGDVRLGASGGRLLDALPLTDDGNNVDQNDLIYHWIDAGLIAGTPDYEGAYIRGLKQDAANYKARVEEQYELFTRGEANQQIKDMFTKKDGTAYADVADYLAADEKYKALQDAYDPEKVQFAWTKDQLLYAIRNAVVNKESGVSAETQNKVANVQGKNVTLEARGVGMNTNTPTVIKASDLGNGSTESVNTLKLLASADAADVTMRDANGNTLAATVEKEIQPDGDIMEKQVWTAYDKAGNKVETDGVIDTFVINNMSPLGVYATGRVDVTASGDNVFIAGRSNDQAGFAAVNVGKITASDQKDVRLYTREGIYNSAATDDEAMKGNIRSHNLIAYGGTKDIGEKEKPLTVNLSGDLLGAYADGNVYVKNVLSDYRLRLGSVFAKDTIYLESAKGFAMTTNLDYQLAYLNAEKQLELKADRVEGRFGEEDNPIRILNNGGIISLTGKDGYVKGVNGTQGDDAVMKLGRIEMTDIFTAASEGNLEAGVTSPEEKDEDGNVVKPEVPGEVKAGGNVMLKAVKDVILDHSVTAGTLNLENGTFTGGGEIDLVSTKGRILQNADGGLVAGSVTATSGKGVTLTDEGNTFREFTAYGVDTEVTDAQGNKVTEKVIDGSVNVRTHAGSMLAAGIEGTVVYGDVALANLDDGGLTVDTDIVTKKGNHGEAGNITFSQQGDILVSPNVALQAGGSVFAASSDGAVSVLGTVVAARDIDVKTGSGKLRIFGDVRAGNDILAATESGYIEMDNGVAAQHDIVATSRTGNIGLMGDIYAGNDVNAQTGGDGRILFNLNFITGRHEVHAGRDVNLTIDNSVIMIAGKVTTDTGDIRTTAKTGGMIFSGSVQAGNDIIASVTGDGVIQYSGTVNAARDIIATTAAGNVNYEKQVEAGRSVMALTDKGDVTYNASVVAEDSVLADVLDGNVTVNNNIVARQGYVTLTLADGSATVGKADGTGNIKAGNDVSITTSKGDATVKTSITSDNGSVSVSSEKGNINVGEVPTANAILAQKDVNLYVADGVITINGSTHTAEGKGMG